MGKLRILSGRQICRILEADGFSQARQRGSHVVMQKSTDQGTVTVPVPNHDQVAIGTLLSIIRQSGLGRSPFES
jgi:predicted RNA binding protein YcfA (HicA-like mRNA interferase family)